MSYRAQSGASLPSPAPCSRHPSPPPRTPEEPVRRIGWLRPNPSPPALREALLQGLHDMGYVEGQNLSIEFRHGEGNAALLPTLAAELVGLPVKVPSWLLLSPQRSRPKRRPVRFPSSSRTCPIP